MRKCRIFLLVLLASLIPVIACCFRGTGGKVDLDVGMSGLYSWLSSQHQISRWNSSAMNFNSKIEVADYAFCVCQPFKHNELWLKSGFCCLPGPNQPKGDRKGKDTFWNLRK